MEDDMPLDEAPAGGRAPVAELIKRVLSGVVFAALALGLAWAGLIPFAVLVLAVALLMSWEWSRIVRSTDLDLALIVHATAVTAAVVLTAFGYAGLGFAVVVIGAIILLPVEFGERPVLSAAGVLYTGLPAVALLWLRGDEPMGFLAVLFVFLVVWATDTGAFAAGRLIGGPKLAPVISPNKTWSGLAGGIVAGIVTALIFSYFVEKASAATLAINGALLGLIAQGGDLAESALKRAFGVKDASNLIPGHGGFMDRVDGIVTAAVAAALAALFINAHAPADALFFRF